MPRHHGAFRSYPWRKSAPAKCITNSEADPKPEPEVYLHLLAWFGLSPRQAWMIGDNLDWEVAAPQRHGMTGIWCNCHGVSLPDGAGVTPDHVITSVAEVLTLLGMGHKGPGASVMP